MWKGKKGMRLKSCVSRLTGVNRIEFHRIGIGKDSERKRTRLNGKIPL